MTNVIRQDLAHVLGNLAVDMQGRSDSESTLQAIVDGAVAVVPGTRWAGISLIEGQNVTPRMPSHPLVADLDSLQARLNEGPCLTATRAHQTVHIADMTSETRWRRFTEAAVARGVHSLLAFRLYVHTEDLGSLNLYGAETEAFDHNSMFYGQLLAQHASVAVMGAETDAQFRDALSNRDLIGQAKGILMHRENLTGVAAFALLVRTSRDAEISLDELARWIVGRHEAGVNPT